MLKAFTAAALAGALLVVALPAFADPAATCGAQACRKGGFSIAVRDDKATRVIPVVRSPYVLPNGSITLYPGETIAVQFTLSGDKLSAPKFVKAYAPRLPAQLSSNGKLSDNPDNTGLPRDDASNLPPNTVLLSYGQFKGQPGMVLEIEHNMPRTVKVDAILSLIQAGSYAQKPTSTCPVRPKLVGFETWPQALGPLMLANPRFAADGDGACR